MCCRFKPLKEIKEVTALMFHFLSYQVLIHWKRNAWKKSYLQRNQIINKRIPMKKNWSEEDKDMIVNEISLVIQNILSITFQWFSHFLMVNSSARSLGNNFQLARRSQTANQSKRRMDSWRARDKMLWIPCDLLMRRISRLESQKAEEEIVSDRW